MSSVLSLPWWPGAPKATFPEGTKEANGVRRQTVETPLQRVVSQVVEAQASSDARPSQPHTSLTRDVALTLRSPGKAYRVKLYELYVPQSPRINEQHIENKIEKSSISG